MNNKVSILAVVFCFNFVAVNTSLAIEKNTVFIPQNRTISQDQIKIAQGIEPRVIKLRLADSGVSVGSIFLIKNI